MANFCLNGVIVKPVPAGDVFVGARAIGTQGARGGSSEAMWRSWPWWNQASELENTPRPGRRHVGRPS